MLYNREFKKLKIHKNKLIMQESNIEMLLKEVAFYFSAFNKW